MLLMDQPTSDYIPILQINLSCVWVHIMVICLAQNQLSVASPFLLCLIIYHTSLKENTHTHAHTYTYIFGNFWYM